MPFKFVFVLKYISMFASRQAPIKICRRHGDTERKKQNNKRLNLDTDEHRKKRFTLIKRLKYKLGLLERVWVKMTPELLIE